MYSNYFNDVGLFHAKFGLTVSYSYFASGLGYANMTYAQPHFLPADQHGFRLKFMYEELNEFVTATEEGDLAKAADALVDLVYVALGTAHLMGLPFNALWAEVQRANLAKERATSGRDSRSKRKHRLDVVKPEGWEPPDIVGTLKLSGWVDPDEPEPIKATTGDLAE